MHKRLKWILPVALFLWCAFIFHFSLADAAESSETSGRVTAFFNDLLADAGASLRFSGLFVRKAAHFTEFFVLGLLSFATAATFLRAWPLPAAVGFSAVVAAVDECLQFASPGRAPGVLDALLDTAGAAAGALLLWLILFLVAKKRKNEKNT